MVPQEVIFSIAADPPGPIRTNLSGTESSLIICPFAAP